MNRFLIYSYHKALLFLSLLHFSSILIFILYHVQNSILKFFKIRLLDHVHFQLKHIISYLVEMNTIKSSHIWSPENTLSVQARLTGKVRVSLNVEMSILMMFSKTLAVILKIKKGS